MTAVNSVVVSHVHSLMTLAVLGCALWRWPWSASQYRRTAGSAGITAWQIWTAENTLSCPSIGQGDNWCYSACQVYNLLRL